jgi:hypothetical protein
METIYQKWSCKIDNFIIKKRTRETKRSLKKKSKNDDGKSDKKGNIVMPLF